MSYYKLQNLGSESVPNEKDIFELVGTIVHQGTLQFGHYWSYAKEQDPRGQEAETWYRLEDSRATPADLDTVMNECRGGPIKFANGTVMDRADSAYILFYKRMSSKGQSLSPCASSPTSPSSRTLSHADSIPGHLQEILTTANEKIVQTVHIFDRAHAIFVQNLLLLANSKFQFIHTVEVDLACDQALATAWQYFGTVIIHKDSLEDLEDYATMLQNVALCKPRAAVNIIRLVSRGSSFFDLLFHHKLKVRQAFVRILMTCLKVIRGKSPEAYGIGSDEPLDSLSMIGAIVRQHFDMRLELPEKRLAWVEYFDLISQIAALGPQETRLVFEHNVLTYCAHILWIRHDRQMQEGFPTIWSHMQNGRLYPFVAVVDCIYQLLSNHVDLLNLCLAKQDNRCGRVQGEMYTLTYEEADVLFLQRKDRGRLIQEACTEGDDAKR